MPAAYHSIREIAQSAPSKVHQGSTKRFGEGDYLVLFGELFQRGYANGLLSLAAHRGMNVIRTTVGRREKDNSLRALTTEELQQVDGPVINVPLEAGFDLESVGGAPFIDCLKDVKSDWESFRLDAGHLEAAITSGRKRFTAAVQSFVKELEKMIPAGRRVYIAHLMAGGVPRTRAIMPPMNRVFKGVGERHLPSEGLWKSDLGRLVDQSFNEVTAETFATLLRETADFRARQEKAGGQVSYSAYGYHGTEVILDGRYQWQSYAPYLQGWAKLKLEAYATEWNRSGVKVAVYNCPEILTNSSSIFQGVEVPLYPLLRAIEREGSDATKTQSIFSACQKLLKEGETVESVLKMCDATLLNPAIRAQSVFDRWPQHNTKEQMEALLTASDAIIGKHKDPKNLMTIPLSEIVFSASGRIMMDDIVEPAAPVSWINHDVVAKWFHAFQ